MGKKDLEVSPGLTRDKFKKKWGFDPLEDKKHPAGYFDVNQMKIQAKKEGKSDKEVKALIAKMKKKTKKKTREA